MLKGADPPRRSPALDQGPWKGPEQKLVSISWRHNAGRQPPQAASRARGEYPTDRPGSSGNPGFFLFEPAGKLSELASVEADSTHTDEKPS
jgi:hypothetical protein